MAIKPNFYKQTDAKWSTHSWKGVTVGGSGCGPTCVANVVSALIKDVKPNEVFDWICKNGYMDPNLGTYWNGITNALKHYGINKFKVSYTPGEAKAALEKGHWVIGVVRKSRWTNGGHYILLYSITSKNKLLVSDPASSSDYRQKEGSWSEYAYAMSCQWIDINPSDYAKKNTNKQKTYTYTMWVSDKTANVRKGRGTNYGVVGKLKRGTKLTLQSYKNGWYQIAVGNYKGKYIHESTLSKYEPYVATFKMLTNMNVRSGYTTKSSILKVVQKGYKTKSSKKKGNWYYFPTLKGWICQKDGKETYMKEVK